MARYAASLIRSSFGESGQNFNVVRYLLHTFDVFHDAFRIGFQSGRGYLPHESDLITIDPIGQVIEHTVIRKHHQLMPDLPYKSLVSFGILMIGETDRARQCEDEGNLTSTHGNVPPFFGRDSVLSVAG